MARTHRIAVIPGDGIGKETVPESLKVLVASNPHAPANFRAIAPPANMPEFATAFQCKDGDAMVRRGDKQVVIW